MDHARISLDDKKILHCLSNLPKKMLTVHGSENTAEFVLHELCGKHCFNIAKAAYFVENPDFNCCKGVAGYCKRDSATHAQNFWEQPEHFSEHLKNPDSFNQKVRGLHHESIHGKNIDAVVHALAEQLGITKPQYGLTHLKHGNKGLLVFEEMADTEHKSLVEEHLDKGLSLFGFCPVF